jgi:hypothetical protein
VSKSFAGFIPCLEAREHLYEAAQGYKPRPVRILAASIEEAHQIAVVMMGCPPYIDRIYEDNDDYGPGQRWFLSWNLSSRRPRTTRR